jgi:hypothetical protein
MSKDFMLHWEWCEKYEMLRIALVWKHEHVWCKSQNHKHVYETKCWTKYLWIAYP